MIKIMGYVVSSLRGLFLSILIFAKKSCKDDTTQTITLVMGNEKMYSSMRFCIFINVSSLLMIFSISFTFELIINSFEIDLSYKNTKFSSKTTTSKTG